MNVVLGHAELIQSEATGEVYNSAELILEAGQQLVQMAEKE